MPKKERKHNFIGTERVVVDPERLERALKTWARWLANKPRPSSPKKRPEAG